VISRSRNSLCAIESVVESLLFLWNPRDSRSIYNALHIDYFHSGPVMLLFLFLGKYTVCCVLYCRHFGDPYCLHLQTKMTNQWP
jgi:hypothetical protein